MMTSGAPTLQQNGRRLIGRLPVIVNRPAALDWTAEGGCLHMSVDDLRGFAGGLGFDGLLVLYLGPAHVDLDLLGLGFSLLGQSNLQHALVVGCRDFLGIHGGGKGEGAGKAAVLALHTAVVLFFLFFFDLALAVHGEGVVLEADVDVFLVDARNFNLQRDGVLVFVDVDCGGKARGGQGFILAGGSLSVGLAEYAIDAVLQGGELAERLETGKYGHGSDLLHVLISRNSAVPFSRLDVYSAQRKHKI